MSSFFSGAHAPLVTPSPFGEATNTRQWDEDQLPNELARDSPFAAGRPLDIPSPDNSESLIGAPTPLNP